MEVLHKNSDFPTGVSLILGFFDGVHAGHQKVIENCPDNKKLLVTFSKSPSEYFGAKTDYIYTREYNYKLIEKLGVDFVFEQEFSELASISAQDYLEGLVSKFKPVSITTGFNHTFGTNRQGNPAFLEKNQKDFKYFCTPPAEIDGEIVSSTLIKKFLSEGNIEKANRFLNKNFSLESKVIQGAQLGRKLGFPTANMKYPDEIVRMPYGVYRVKVFELPAIMNWGIKPTIGAEETIEVHIPNYNDDLYGKDLRIEIISKIRDERKFETLNELKLQIEKDIKECLK